MNKKGVELPMILIAELLVLALVAYVVFHNVFDVINHDDVFKENAGADLKMMIDTLVGLPGDVIVKYPQSLSEYNVAILDNNKVAVFLPDDRLRKDWNYFFLPEGYSARGTAEQQRAVCLRKMGKTISIEPCQEVLPEDFSVGNIAGCSYLPERQLPTYLPQGSADLRQQFCEKSTLTGNSLDFRTVTEPRTIKKVVLHYTYGVGTGQAVADDWASREAAVSAHYVIDRSGKITYVVDEQDIAYHAMNHNSDSIGIELVNLGPGCDASFDLGEGNYHQQSFCNAVETTSGIYPQKQGYDKQLDYQQFTSAQMEALISLMRGMQARYNFPLTFGEEALSSGITGHIYTENQVLGKSQIRKVDPGPAFPWNYFACRVQDTSGCETLYPDDVQKISRVVPYVS
ncbi:MAG TPA: N-acetylmuramoyl-L-alanine amidase [Candidatus Nanoarchaeia archaeon]|nr:N-acetylmuramoyl-L-alanine amidase [Candidatus Nanoarchaeia archaeon]